MPVPFTTSNIVPWTQVVVGISQTIFSTNWTANAASDIVVYNRLPDADANDVLQLVDPNDYTVQFIGATNEVQVTFVLAPDQYNIVTITRNTLSQFLNLYTNTNFTPTMLNGDFERLTLIDQQNQLLATQYSPHYNQSASVILQNGTSGIGGDEIIPILGANQVWIKNNDNTEIIPFTITSDIVAGLINPAEQYAIAYYTIAGSEISGLDVLPNRVLVTDGSGIPSLSTVITITDINDIYGHAMLQFGTVAAAVNYVELFNNATGQSPVFHSEGSDSNVGMIFQTKGNASFTFDTLGTSNQFTWNTGTTNQSVLNWSIPNVAQNITVNTRNTTGTMAYTTDIVALANGVSGNLPVSNLNSGTAAGPTTFWAGDGTWKSAAAAAPGLLNMQVFLTSGTYTPTSGVVSLIVICMGGGGGSGGYGTTNTGGTGGTGGTTSFGTLCVALGGVGSTAGNASASLVGTGGPIAGGTGTFILPGSDGNAGSGGSSVTDPGGSGGSGLFGAGSGSSGVNATGTIGGINTGAGAGGWSQIGGVSSFAVSGGGSGSQSWLFTTTVTSQTVTIGAAGLAGTAGGGGAAGLAGGSGICIVLEFK